MREVVLGFGANVGSRIATIDAALAMLESDPDVRVVGRAALYETDPVGPPQPRYVNTAARIRTALSLEAILDRALSIERALGRERRMRWGPRVLDIDVLWAGDEAVQTDRLTVPHPRLRERAFALAPLLSLAPEAGEELHAALRVCGGPPEVIAEPRVETSVAEATRAAVASGGDAADLLAFALRAVASDRQSEGAVEAVAERPRGEDAGGFLEVLCRIASEGFDVRGVSLVITPPEGPVLRAIGCQGMPVERLIPMEAQLDESKARVSAEVRTVSGLSRDGAK